MPAAITPELWRAAEGLFHAALERPADERPAFLGEVCAQDPALLAEVSSLLAAFEGPEVFSDHAAVELACGVPACGVPACGVPACGVPACGVPACGSEGAAETPAAPFPERLGPYRLLEVLGEGGMSTVYLAEQSEPLPRRVALKLMRWGGVHGQALRRFELERQALARMSHPTIAQVFGAGATEHGQPYVVIEHVPGPPITDYCDARRLGVEQRLRLFVAVCHGVGHAHGKAVIHRDLKPSNILVTEVEGDPVPKIIDFGIAKCLEPWSVSADLTTLSQLRVGSPGYMSPEAITGGGRGVDTRSDVYSLGVVLCQLLIGVRPFESPPGLLAPALVEGRPIDPPRPSRRFAALSATQRRQIAGRRKTGEGRLLRQLRGELDWIVARAIAHEAADRYGSVQELAADVEAWLAGLPVAAKPPSVLYRARKALRRHAAAFVTAGLVASTLVAFSLRSNLLYRRAETARVQAEELVNFMLDDLSAQLEPMGHLDLLESVARRSLAYFESSDDGGGGPGGGRPTAALRQIGQVLASRGDLDAARNAYERALAIDRQRRLASPDDPSPRLDLAHDLELLAELHRARDELERLGDRLGEAESLLRELAAELPGHLEVRVDLARVLGDIVNLRRLQGELAQGAALCQEALAMVRELERGNPENLEVRRVLAGLHYISGMLLFHGFDDAEGAAREFEAGAEIFRQLTAGRPEASLWRYRLAVLEGQGLVTTYQHLGRVHDARAANRRAMDLLESLVREQPRNSRWAFAFGWELIRQGLMDREAGELDNAAGAFRRSIEVQSALLERTPGQPDTAWLDGLATAYKNLSLAESGRGEASAALRAAEISLQLRRRMIEHPDDIAYKLTRLVSAGVRLGELHFEAGEGAEKGVVLELLEEAGAAFERLEGMEVEEPAVLDELAATRQRYQRLLLGK